MRDSIYHIPRLRGAGRLDTPAAVQTYCSECGAAAGEPCLYVMGVNESRASSHSPKIIAARARVGTPTQRPHGARHRPPARRLQIWLAEHGTILWEDPE